MKTIEEIRQANLRLLLADGLRQADIASAMNKSPKQVSQWFGKGSARAISSALARELEAAIGKPRGWLDNPHDSVVVVQPSHFAGPDPVILHEAVRLLLFDIDHGGPRKARSASALLMELYQRIDANDGRLPPDEERAFEEAARTRGKTGASTDDEQDAGRARGHR